MTVVLVVVVVVMAVYNLYVVFRSRSEKYRSHMRCPTAAFYVHRR